ncbi:hypothetical protein SAMN04487996_109215 [Dyadobacter soli]|uniref:Uncharacterized protein n=1 Tax=Dyadobacter soli TaxID=659014 RepID=A0A1G7J8L2_9BACT|nr:hypothetical protein SAMN04487996_109215 [Dyadobacter soli]
MNKASHKTFIVQSKNRSAILFKTALRFLKFNIYLIIFSLGLSPEQ